MKRIQYWFRSFKMVKTVWQAQRMGLTHLNNVYGDGINHLNCRSFWEDEFKNVYRCEELYTQNQ